MSGRLLRLAVPAAALAALASLPAAASAATVGRSGDAITVTAGPGERNMIAVEVTEGPALLLTDAGPPLAVDPASGCSQIEAGTPEAGVQCPAPPGTGLVVALGDGDDRYAAEDGVALPESIGGFEGNDEIEAGDGPGGISGGDGDDRLDGRGGNDIVRGDDGADLLRGGSGADDLDGGPGDDRVDARTGNGRDVVTCAPGQGEDAILDGTTDVLRDCGGPPRASLRLPRQRVRSFFDEDGLDFRVRCARQCAIGWEIVARDRSTRRRIHQRDRRLDKAAPRRDSDGFPRFLPAGWHELHARPVGRTTRRDIAAARVLRLRLRVTVTGRNAIQVILSRAFTLRR